MWSAQTHELRGDRGNKEKKKPKAQKPGKGQKTRESLVTQSAPQPVVPDRPTKESGSGEK